MRAATLSLVLAIAGAASAQSGAWGQCGGVYWTGATTCIPGYTCTYSNPYYSQCLPNPASPTTSSTRTTLVTSSRTSSFPTAGSPSTSSTRISTTSRTSSMTRLPTTSATSTRPFSNPTSSRTSTSTSTSTRPVTSTTSSTGGGSTGYPGTTLKPGYLWIRAVSPPNFHKYLQTNPVYQPGIALLETYTTAGQFNVVNGQLVELVAGGMLYGTVQPLAESTGNKLALTFTTSPNTFGAFSFSGDTLQWSAPGVARQNPAAWLVCAGQQLFINLGPYAYQTPAGCADQTIHYYNDSVANP